MIEIKENASRAAGWADLAKGAGPMAATLQDLFEQQVLRRPLQRALLCEHDPFWGTSEVSFEWLNARANQVARRLRQEGVGPGHIVAILMERSFALIIGIWGVIKSGAAYVPLSLDDPAERLSYVLADAQVSIVLVHEATVGKAPRKKGVLNLEDEGMYTGSSLNLENLNRGSDLAYVIYTSGSTGKPKGVMIEHHSVINRLQWMQEAYPIDQDDVLLQKTPCCFDVSVWELFWWALQGATLCLLRPHGERFPQVLTAAIEKHRVSMIHFVPPMLNVFLEYVSGKPKIMRRSLSSIRRVFASGEALSPAHVLKFNRTIGQQTGARLTNLYGPTEATVDATFFDCPGDGDVDVVPIGRPIRNLRAYVIRDGAEMAVGEAGELCLAGVGLARGYLNNPQLTLERFTPHPARPGERIYRTGDVARWLPDGNLEYLGREDQQVKIRGVRIELGEIENTIRLFPGIVDCAVTPRKYSDSLVLIAAFLVCNRPVEAVDLKLFLEQFLPSCMVPGFIATIDNLPLTPNGKVDRKQLAQLPISPNTPGPHEQRA